MIIRRLKIQINHIFNFFRVKLIRRESQNDLPKIIFAIFLACVVGYILAPKFIFNISSYEEDDILQQDIFAERDLLLIDQSSTELKKNQLIEQQGQIFDYDPNLLNTTVEKVEEVFQKIQDDFNKINNVQQLLHENIHKLALELFNLNQNSALLIENINFYQTLQIQINNKLQILKKKTSLNSKEFYHKQQLDNHYNLIKALLQKLNEKKELLKKEIPQKKATIKEQSANIINQKIIFNKQKEEAIKKYIKLLPVTLDDQIIQNISPNFFIEENKEILIKLLKQFLNHQFIISKEVFQPSNKSIIEIHNLVSGETVKKSDFNDVLELEIVREQISDAIKKLFFDKSSQRYQTLMLLLQKLIRPTVTENKQAFEERKEELIKNMNPVYFSFKKGEMIARRGERLNLQKVEIINSYYNVVSNVGKIPIIIGRFIISFVVSFFIYCFLFWKRKKRSMALSDLILVISAIIINLVLIKLGIFISETIEVRYGTLSSFLYLYVFPVSLASVLVSILLSYEVAIISGLMASFYVAIIMENNLNFFFFIMVSNLIAASPITKFDSRWSLLNHGIKISITNFFAVIILFLIQSNKLFDPSIGSNLLLALTGGLLTTLFVTFLLPFFESIFDITTNLKLLELSNINHPALKDLMFKAPGTYQHSIIVGNLAETAAVKIGANSLLARIGAYYHDLGKVMAPKYFIENISENTTNPHDVMNDPHKSAKIVINHIKHGKDLADKYRLDKSIKNILLQHHGTMPVKFFYYKAQEQFDGKINRSDFCYSGPKPQTKEAALVMLADCSEAATRSLKDPTPESIKEIVIKVGNNLLLENQFDECGMTFKEYQMIIESYIDILTNVHHQRIKYPDQDQEGENGIHPAV